MPDHAYDKKPPATLASSHEYTGLQNETQYETGFHESASKHLASAPVTARTLLQLQRQIGNQAVQRLLNTQQISPSGTQPMVQREVEDIGNNQVTALISDVITNGAGTFLMFEGTKYWIDRFPSRDSFGQDEKITFTLDSTGLRKTAVAQNTRQKIEQGMQEVRQNQINQEDEKRYYEGQIKRARILRGDFRFTDSAYKHCLDGKKDSRYVGDLGKQQVRQRVIDYVLDNVDNVTFVKISDIGGQEFKLVIGGIESIVFTYNRGWITVFHVGPSLA